MDRADAARLLPLVRVGAWYTNCCVYDASPIASEADATDIRGELQECLDDWDRLGYDDTLPPWIWPDFSSMAAESREVWELAELERLKAQYPSWVRET